MSRIAYVNGRYLPLRLPAIQVEDRGLQFADSVYEVILVEAGRLVDEEPHLDRLDRSLGEIRLVPAMGRRALKSILREVVRRNRVDTGMVYLQMTRGVAPRDAAFPRHARTTLIVTARGLRPPDPDAVTRGVGVITIPDLRWKRCDIKATALLANVLARQAGVDAGVFDAWQVDEAGFVTEGSASNAWIVTRAGEIVTRPATPAILRGVTRMTLIAIARRRHLRLVERPFTVAEARAAHEAFLTNASARVLPVTRIDGRLIGDGRAGPVTQALIEGYRSHATGGDEHARKRRPERRTSTARR